MFWHKNESNPWISSIFMWNWSLEFTWRPSWKNSLHLRFFIGQFVLWNSLSILFNTTMLNFTVKWLLFAPQQQSVWILNIKYAVLLAWSRNVGGCRWINGPWRFYSSSHTLAWMFFGKVLDMIIWKNNVRSCQPSKMSHILKLLNFLT